MQFKRLRAINFLTLGDSGDLHLAGRGLNLLQGVNLDDTSASSNGAGKSSVVDALCWVLYGCTSRGSSGDSVVNRTAKKGTMVELELVDGQVTYLVRRHRKHPQGKNALHLFQLDGAGAQLDRTKGTDKETQAELTGIMGCTLEVFVASIYAGQESMADLPSMTDRPLKMLIEEAAGVQKLERGYEIALKEQNAAQRAWEAHQVEVQRAAQAVTNAELDLERAKLAHDQFEAGREGNAKVHLESAAQSQAQAQAIVLELRGQDEAGMRAELQQISENLASISLVRQTADEYARTTVEPVKRLLAQLQMRDHMLRNEAAVLRGRFDNAAAELAKPCGACGKPHTADELETLKGHIKQQLLAKAAEIQSDAGGLERTQRQLDEANAEHQRLLSLVPDAGQLAQRQAALSGVLYAIDQKKAQARQLIEATKVHQQRAEAARTADNPHLSLLMNVGERVTAARKHVEDLKVGTQKLADELEEARVTAQVFGPAGVRAHILDTVTPFLNERTLEYLGTLSDGNISATWSTLSKNAKGELREKFAIEVDHAKGGEGFDSISGGEKRKVRLATMWALQDLVASRASKPIDLWIGDEIDVALDEPGLERLMAVLERKARERGTVIVISHNPLRDWIDDATIITKKDGQSTVQGALCVA